MIVVGQELHLQAAQHMLFAQSITFMSMGSGAVSGYWQCSRLSSACIPRYKSNFEIRVLTVALVTVQ